MDLRQLRYFVAIVEARSFSKAALVLRIAQPALSLHVRNMEADLGTELLLRTPQGVVPTPAGALLVQRARSLLSDFEAARREVTAFSGEPAGEVRLGLPGTIGEMLTVPLVLRTREAYPKIRLTVAEAMSGFVLDWLYEGRVDLGILYSTVDERGLRSRALICEDLRLFGPAGGVVGAPLPAGPATIETIAALPLVLPGAAHGLRLLIDAEFAKAGLEPAAVIEVDAYGAIKELVGHGVGYSILPHNAIHGEVETGRFEDRPIGDPPLSRTIHLVRPFDRPADIAADAVARLCSRALEDLVTSGRWRARLLAG